MSTVLEPFPALVDNSRLIAEDFRRFSERYTEILQRYLPGANEVIFALSVQQLQSQKQTGTLSTEQSSLFGLLKEGDVDCGIQGDSLMYCFRLKDGNSVVAVIFGMDPLFLQKASEDWLLETRGTIEREFLLLKQARVDSQTGLLNMANLSSLLDTFGSTEGLHIILVELVPKRSSYQYSSRYLHKCVTFLVNFVQAESVLHYLGQFVFALVLQQSLEAENPEIESGLVNYLKRAGCHRVHIGSSTASSFNSEKQRCHGTRILDEAWTALRHAVKRGPFSFCDFGRLAHPENHPLVRPDRNLVRRLNRLWSRSKGFCLVLFHSNNVDKSARMLVSPEIDRGEIVSRDGDALVFLDETKPEQALLWAQKVIGRIAAVEPDIDLSAGVSSYPYCDFKKSELVYNCRKALLHASFYGKSSAALFDAVSLNISGDIYFADGDLTKAVQEYKRGLKCDPKDINLHNSLGVALAMMNALPAAVECYEKALSLDATNFMALYNLGLTEQSRNRKPEALAYFEKALQHYSEEEGDAQLVGDLNLQLGILSCELGKYQSALAYLVPWQQENQNSRNAGRVHYYLGQSYYGLTDNKKAMESLQRALRYDELDDRAMSLLGRVYLEEREGDDIALSLCRKSVELEPDNPCYMLYFAQVLLQQGLYIEARDNLHRSLKDRTCKTEAQLLMAKSYAGEGQRRRAKNWFEKVLAQKDCPENLRDRAERGISNLHINKQ